MDFDQIRIFMVLAEERTFLGAANRLETSRSRVRRKLDQLERAAGTPLLSRETSGLVLTPAGEVLARRGRALLQDAERLISSVHEIGTQPTGRLRLALPLGPPAAAWIDALAELQSRHLQLEVEVSFDARPSRLLPTRAEVALTFEEQIAGGHEVVELAETPMRLLAGDGYLSAHGRPATSADLSLERVASWRPHDAWPDSLPLAGGRRVPLSPRVASNDASLPMRLALEGDYLAYVPDPWPRLDPKLERLLPEEVRGVVRERLVVPEVLADLPRVRAFVEECQHAKPRRSPSVATA